MFPSSAGKLRILLEDRSKYTRLWSLAMSEGIRDKELSLRCNAVKWVNDHNDELRLLTFPGKQIETYQVIHKCKYICNVSKKEPFKMTSSFTQYLSLIWRNEQWLIKAPTYHKFCKCLKCCWTLGLFSCYRQTQLLIFIFCFRFQKVNTFPIISLSQQTSLFVLQHFSFSHLFWAQLDLFS